MPSSLPPPPSPEKFRDSLRELRRTYLKRLAAQMPELMRMRELLGRRRPPANDLQQLYRLTHNFSGSGATFGFSELGAAARTLHNAVKSFLDAELPEADTTARASLRNGLEEFIEVCHAASRHEFPFAQDTAAETPPVPEETLVKQIGVWARKPARVEALMEQLSHFGYEVTPVTMAADLAGLFGLVVYGDLGAADLALLEKLRLAQERPPLLLVSPRDDFETRLAAARLGAQGVCGEDVAPQDLIERLEQLAKPHIAPGLHVLVVDGDDMLAEFYSHALRSAGLPATVLTNPREIVRVLAQHDIGLAIINADLPHCSGRELAAVIRQDAACARLPVIFITAQPPEERLGRFDDVLIKPFSPEQLIVTVLRHAHYLEELRLRRLSRPPLP